MTDKTIQGDPMLANAIQDSIREALSRYAPRCNHQNHMDDFMASALSALAHSLICHIAPMRKEGSEIDEAACQAITDHYAANKGPIDEWCAAVMRGDLAETRRGPERPAGTPYTGHVTPPEPESGEAAAEMLGLTPDMDPQERLMAAMVFNIKNLMNAMGAFANMPPADAAVTALNALGMSYLELWARSHSDAVTLEDAAVKLLRDLAEHNKDELAKARLDSQAVAGTA